MCERHDSWLHAGSMLYQVGALGGRVKEEPCSCHLIRGTEAEETCRFQITEIQSGCEENSEECF